MIVNLVWKETFRLHGRSESAWLVGAHGTQSLGMKSPCALKLDLEVHFFITCLKICLSCAALISPVFLLFPNNDADDQSRQRSLLIWFNTVEKIYCSLSLAKASALDVSCFLLEQGWNASFVCKLNRRQWSLSNWWTTTLSINISSVGFHGFYRRIWLLLSFYRRVYLAVFLGHLFILMCYYYSLV